jgi:hypothetical protein
MRPSLNPSEFVQNILGVITSQPGGTTVAEWFVHENQIISPDDKFAIFVYPLSGENVFGLSAHARVGPANTGNLCIYTQVSTSEIAAMIYRAAAFLRGNINAFTIEK